MPRALGDCSVIRASVTIPVIALTLSCSESLPPPVVTRWATTGIELVGTPVVGELRVSCFRPFRVSQGIQLDAQDSINLSGKLTDAQDSVPFLLAGLAHGDTLAAMLNIMLPAGDWVRVFHMTTDGDAALSECQYYR